MLLIRLWTYIRGYVIIFIEGFFLEKFLNICARKQIFLWDIKRRSACMMTLKVSIKGFKLLRPVAGKTGSRVGIMEKVGLPFILNRYRRRKTFILGAAIFLALFYIMTSFVWSVELTGNKMIGTEFFMKKLEEAGIRPGALKYGIDTDKAVNYLMLEVKELAWISLTLKGTKIKVEVVERIMPPELVPKNEPCNIVARRDGVIKAVIVKEGQEKVKEGDTVVKGQVLVSGSVPVKGKGNEARLVHAIASVKARTWYESKLPVSTKINERVRTGKVKDDYTIALFSNKLELFHKGNAFAEFDRERIVKKAALGENLALPFEFIIDRYFEVVFIEKEINGEEAMNIAAEKAYEDVCGKVPADAEIVKTDIRFKPNEGYGIDAVATLECIEQIGMEERIGGN